MNMTTMTNHCWLRRATCAILILMATLTNVLAQPRKEKFNPEKFRADLEEFIAEEANLTKSEGKLLFPIFHEMKEKQRSLQETIFQLKRNTPSSNATDKDYSATIQKIKSLEVEKAELEELYYKKMCKTIPARKVFLVMKAEDKFHRKMFDKFTGKEKNREMKAPRGPKPTAFPKKKKD